MFIERGFEGQNQVWRYLVSIFLVILSYLAGQIPLTVVIAYTALKENRLDEIQMNMDFTTLGISNNLFLALALFMFLLSFICLILVVRFIHKKSIVSIITARSRINLSRIIYAASVWLCLTFLFEFFSYLISPDIYRFNFNLKEFIPLLFIVIIGIPIQSGFEEVFMRGYLMQAIGLIGRYRWVSFFITSILFGLLHSLNPEIQEFGFGLMMVYYIGVGFFLAILTLMDDGLELALGVHIISNIYASIFVTYQGSVLKTSALFRVTELNAELMLAVYFICAIIFTLVVSKKYHWRDWNKLYRKVIKPFTEVNSA